MNFNSRFAARWMFSLVALIGIAGSARAAALPEETHDSRLDQKITYSAYKTPLQEVANSLSKTTGVVIRVGSGERDWKSKERKVHVVFQNITAMTALYELSQTLGYELRRTGAENAWDYRIWQNNRGREYESAMLISQQDAEDQKVAALRQTVLNDANDVTDMKPEEALALSDKDPWKAYLGGTTSGRAYAKILRGLPDQTKELVLRGRKVTLEADDMSPDMQDALKTMSSDILNKMIPASLGSVGDIFKRMSPARIVFQPITPEMGGGNLAQTGMTGLAMIMADPKESFPGMDEMMQTLQSSGYGKGYPIIGMPLTGSGSVIGQAIGKMLLKVESGADVQSAQQEIISQLQTARIQNQEKLNQIVPTPKPTDPALLAEIEPIKLKFNLSNAGDQSDEFLKQLAKKTSLSIAYEYYPQDLPFSMALPQEKKPLYELLDSLQLIGLTWSFHNGVVRIRPKDWAVERSYDVPESSLALYRNILKTKGWFDLDAIGSIVSDFTDEQIQHRFMRDKDLMYAATALVSFGMGNRALLRLYGGLTPQQKTLMKSDKGLSFDQLSEAQWQRLSSIIEDATGGDEVRPGRILLAVKTTSTNADTASAPEKPKSEEKKTAPAKPVPNVAKAAKKPEASGVTSQTNELITAAFTLEMEGEDSDHPVKITRSILVPSKSQIQAIGERLKQMQDQQDKAQADKEKADNADQSATKDKANEPATPDAKSQDPSKK